MLHAHLGRGSNFAVLCTIGAMQSRALSVPRRTGVQLPPLKSSEAQSAVLTRIERTMLVNDLIYAHDQALERRGRLRRDQSLGAPATAFYSTVPAFSGAPAADGVRRDARRWLSYDRHRPSVPPQSKCLVPIRKEGPPAKVKKDPRPTIAELLRKTIKQCGVDPGSVSSDELEQRSSADQGRAVDQGNAADDAASRIQRAFRRSRRPTIARDAVNIAMAQALCQCIREASAR
jgi:hypothetical protein